MILLCSTAGGVILGPEPAEDSAQHASLAVTGRDEGWRRGSESNRRIKVLQTSPLPLGYRALSVIKLASCAENVYFLWPQSPARELQDVSKFLERETGFEPATSTLARSHSTTELLPLVLSFYSTCALLPIHCTRTALPFGSSGTIPNSAIYCS
jgi:hypothetical protein